MKLSEISIKLLLKYFPERLVDKKDSIGSGNGLAPNRRQAIIWTNGDHFTDAYVRIQASILYMYKMLRHNTIMLLGISTKFDECWSKSTTTPAHPLLMTHGIFDH